MKKEIACFIFVLFLALPCHAAEPSKAIVIHNPDKSVAVIYPAPKSQRPNESDEDFLRRVYNRAVVNDPSLRGLAYEIVDASSLPSREFRDAWEGSPGKGIKVNQKKVQKIKLERMKRKILKEEKERVLEELAIEHLKKRSRKGWDSQ